MIQLKTDMEDLQDKYKMTTMVSEKIEDLDLKIKN